MIEMLVVLGIVALVAAMTLPMVVPIMRTRRLDSAVDTVKSAMILTRSKAVQSRRMMNLTLLQQTDATHGAGMIITDYDSLRETVSGLASSGTISQIVDNGPNPTLPWIPEAFLGNVVGMYPSIGGNSQTSTITDNGANTLTISGAWSPLPTAGSLYIIPSALTPSQAGVMGRYPYCAHLLTNYPNSNPDVRFNVLKFLCRNMGEQVRYLPDGCRFDFTTFTNDPIATSSDPAVSANAAVTYLFMPDGEAWTLPPSAQNSYSAWFKTTYMAGGVVSGPKVWGPMNLMSATILVYGTTGQVVSK